MAERGGAGRGGGGFGWWGLSCSNKVLEGVGKQEKVVGGSIGFVQEHER